ncbi:response regulator [Arenibacter algicola]|uniref:response regulator n=1 Tax=Arenibacter algicola TaxID=616991 RepID=UPI001C067F99|nr:response regulator [Arenibacter algicola]MBU2905935.1 response regulator [Arenibacter algicola]
MERREKNKPEIFSIYLVDDDLEDQEIFMEAISQIDTLVELKTFDNADELLLCLKTDSSNPDVIFLDLYMPRKDGEECLKEIRDDNGLDMIPIVVYSTEFDLDRIEHLFSLGANRYLRKPNSYGSLIASLDRTIDSIKRNTLGGTAIINIIV